MDKPKNDLHSLDDQLADFTDHILSREKSETEIPFAPNPELRALERTALRLKNALREDDPSPVAIQRMHKNIVTKWGQLETTQGAPAWKKWMNTLQLSGKKWKSQRSRQRLGLALSLSALVVTMLVSIYFLNITNTHQHAASESILVPGLVVIAAGGLILLALWFFNRKR